MHRPSRIALSVLVLLSACKIERTPEEYFDHRKPSETERDAAADEIRARVEALPSAVRRGDPRQLLAALSPATDVHVTAPVAGMRLEGSDVFAAAAGQLGSLEGADLVLEEVHVTVGPRANVGWFATHGELLRAGEPAKALQASGVFVRSEGEWRLVQAHLALPPALAPEPTAADTLSADTVSTGR